MVKTDKYSIAKAIIIRKVLTIMRFMLLLVLLGSFVGCKATSRSGHPQFIGQVQVNFALHQDNSLER